MGLTVTGDATSGKCRLSTSIPLSAPKPWLGSAGVLTPLFTRAASKTAARQKRQIQLFGWARTGVAVGPGEPGAMYFACHGTTSPWPHSSAGCTPHRTARTIAEGK